MKVALPKTLNKLLTNQFVLYIVLFLSLTNLAGYISMNDTASVLVFLTAGLITSYYTGNMVLVLFIPMVVTNILYGVDRGLNIRETMVEGMQKNKDDTNTEKSKKTKKTNTKNAKKSKKSKTNSPTDVNEKETYEEFFKDINKTMNSDSLEKMTNQTQNLIESQTNLKNAMGQLTPMVDNAKKMMKSLGDMGNMAGFEGFDPKNMNASVKNMMNQFMSGNNDDKSN